MSDAEMEARRVDDNTARLKALRMARDAKLAEEAVVVAEDKARRDRGQGRRQGGRGRGQGRRQGGEGRQGGQGREEGRGQGEDGLGAKKKATSRTA